MVFTFSLFWSAGVVRSPIVIPGRATFADFKPFGGDLFGFGRRALSLFSSRRRDSSFFRGPRLRHFRQRVRGVHTMPSSRSGSGTFYFSESCICVAGTFFGLREWGFDPFLTVFAWSSHGKSRVFRQRPFYFLFFRSPFFD